MHVLELLTQFYGVIILFVFHWREISIFFLDNRDLPGDFIFLIGERKQCIIRSPWRLGLIMKKYYGKTVGYKYLMFNYQNTTCLWEGFRPRLFPYQGRGLSMADRGLRGNNHTYIYGNLGEDTWPSHWILWYWNIKEDW